ncbi:MAG: DUF1015 domain-containing protein [Clostridia bacterium]|nr:DUF1015 domain-containing protein [Clostridia bacterium]
MAGFMPFKGLRYDADGETLSKRLCPPYDIISPAQRQELIEKDGKNFVRAELPEGEEPYAEAAKLIKSWTKDGTLKREKKPAFYIYEEEFSVGGKKMKIKGVIGALKLEEFSKGVVLPHEETLSKAKEDRFRLLDATRVNTSLIYSMYESDDVTRGLIEALSSGKPDAEAVTDDGITHRLWISADKEKNAALSARFADKKLYIADGHHRYETALNFRNHLREKGEAKPGDPADSVMMFVIDIFDPGLVVFPTHRLVRNVEGFDAKELVKKLSETFETEELDDPAKITKKLGEAKEKRAIGFYADKKAYVLTLRDESAADFIQDHCFAYKRLDVTALHSLILEKYFGIDKENMATQKNLVYIRDPEEAFRKIDDGQFQCVFVLNPTKIKQVADVALSGDKMPQKSTYFYPKLITGLVMRELI